MAEKTVVVDIKYDVKEALSSLDSLSKEIEENKQKQNELKKLYKEGAISVDEYSRKTEVLKTSNQKLNAERKNNIQLIQSEKGSINELRANVSKLTKERNSLNLNTKEGQKRLKEINSEIDKHNNVIKGNVDGLTQQRMNIGNYKSALEGLPAPMQGVVSGIGGITKAGLSFIATPIGAIVAALAAAFLLVKNAMDRSEETMNKVKKAFSPFQGIVNGILKALEPLGEFLIDGIVWGLEKVEEAFMSAIDLVAAGLEALGFDEAAKGVRDFKNEIEEAAIMSEKLAAAEAKLQEEQRKSGMIQLEYQKRAEKLRQIRDDESKSIEERIKANEELGAVLKEQLQEELKIAELALEVTNLRMEQEGRSTALLDEQAEAMTRIADIQERITGQESEQLVNRVSLQKEATEKRIANMEAELNFKKEQLRFEQDELKVLKELYDEEKAIFKAKLDAKQISQAEYNTEILKLNNDIRAKEMELSKQKEQQEKDEEKRRQEKLALEKKELEKIEAKRLKIAESEKERLKKIDERRGEAIAKLAEIKQRELELEAESADELRNLKLKKEQEEFELLMENKELEFEERQLLEEEHKLRMVEINAEYEDTVRAQREETLRQAYIGMQGIVNATRGMADQRLAILGDAFAKITTINFKELESAKEKFIAIGQSARGLTNIITSGHQAELASLENQKQSELLEFGETAEMKEAIEKKFARKLDRAKEKQARQAKTQALIDAGIATALAVTQAMSAPAVPPFPGAIAAGILGAVQIGIIASKTPASFNSAGAFAKGGVIDFGGKRHSQGGTHYWGSDGGHFEVERGERMYVLNRDASSHVRALSNINESYGGRAFGKRGSYMQDGGMVEPNQTDIGKSIRDALMDVTIVTKVSDISTGLTQMQAVKNNAVI